jgi:MtaA/CmuA family methyltransferase
MGDLLIAVEALRNHFRGERSVFGWADAPFAEACNLITTPVMLMTIMDDPPFAHALLEFCTQVVCAFLEAQLALGVGAVGIGDAAASLISPKMYDEFAFPYERRVIDAVHRRGVPVKLHICGNATTKLPRIVTTGIDILNVDHMTDIRLARRLTPSLCLTGNLDPVRIMYGASPEDVCAAGRQLICDVGPCRYIHSAGCEVPPDIAPENLKALVACAHDHEVTA